MRALSERTGVSERGGFYRAAIPHSRNTRHGILNLFASRRREEEIERTRVVPRPFVFPRRTSSLFDLAWHRSTYNPSLPPRADLHDLVETTLADDLLAPNEKSSAFNRISCQLAKFEGRSALHFYLPSPRDGQGQGISSFKD